MRDSDDIAEIMRRAGADDGRPLGFGGADVLRTGRSRRRRRRVYGGSATALGVTAVATAAWAILPASLDDRSEPAPTGEPDSVPLDRGPMSETEVRDALVHCQGEGNDLTTIYARKVDSRSGTEPAVLATAESPNGSVDTCGMGWSFSAGVQLTRSLDRAHPIEPITTDPTTTTDGGEWLAVSGFYWVADSVARVETRVGTPGGSEPWRVSRPHNGVVFSSAWADEGAYDDDDEVWLQWRAFDTDGDRIDPALLPDQPQLIDPTGSNEVAAEYDEISGLLGQVALDHLRSERGSLEPASARYGSRDDAAWSTVTTYLGWSPRRSVATVVVELSLSRQDTYTDGDLRARIGCQTRFECQRVDLGDQGWAWVGKDGAGNTGVGHVQPDGEIAYIVIGAEHPYLENMDGGSDLTVDEALNFVIDDRLDMPAP